MIVESYPFQVHAAYVTHTEVFGVLNTAVLQLEIRGRTCAVCKVLSNSPICLQEIAYPILGFLLYYPTDS